MDEDTLLVAKLFRGFSDPTRLAILRRLMDGPARVTDLVEHLGCSQANVSGHLACLRDCGLIDARPEGRATRYGLVGDHVLAVIRSAEALLAEQGTHVDLCANHGVPGVSSPNGGSSLAVHDQATA